MSACVIPLSQPMPIADLPPAFRLRVVSAAGAGFPSPAQDWEETAIDLVALLRLDGSEQLFGDLAGEDAERQLQSRQQLLQRRLEQSLGERGEALPLVSQGRHWIALLPCPTPQDEARNRQVMTALLDELRPQLGPLRLFLGLGSAGCDAPRFAQGLGEARQALAVAQRFPERLGLCSFNELGVLELLGAIRDRSLLDRFLGRKD